MSAAVIIPLGDRDEATGPQRRYVVPVADGLYALVTWNRGVENWMHCSAQDCQRVISVFYFSKGCPHMRSVLELEGVRS